MDIDCVALYVSLGSLVMAVASLIACIRANSIAGGSLAQAVLVAERDRDDWAQTKWFDLYFQLNEAYDFFDEFQTKLGGKQPSSWGQSEEDGWNRLMHLIRRVHAMAMVFPKNSIIDNLVTATVGFKNHEEALSKERLKRVFDAWNDMRECAFLNADVLNRVRKPDGA